MDGGSAETAVDEARTKSFSDAPSSPAGFSSALLNCKIPWHEGIACTAYRADNPDTTLVIAEHEVLTQLKNWGAKRCPRYRFIV